MSVGAKSSHLDDLYGYQLSKQTISNITESIIVENIAAYIMLGVTFALIKQ